MATKEEAKKKRKSAKSSFHRVYNVLIVDAERRDTKIDVLMLQLNDLESKYQKLEEKHELLIEALESDNEDDKTTEVTVTNDMETMYAEYIQVRKLVHGKQEEKKDERRKEKKGFELVQIKKLDAPFFSGNIRDYPTFRKDYEHHMISRYGSDPFALKKCLSGDAELAVRGVEDNFDEMLKRLDERYGRPEKLVDSVMSELRRIQRVPDDDSSKFVAMVEKVEKCWLDLRKMSLESEMDTAVMVSQVEKLLPSIQKREWALLRQKAGHRSKCGFSVFLDFLLLEKNALEYMSADVRKMTDLKCKVNSVESKSSTSDNAEDYGASTMQGQMKLVMEGLTQVLNAISRPTPYTVSKSGRENRSGCWLHSTDGHDIFSCKEFISLEPQGRFNLAKQHFICFQCLKGGHSSRRCFSRSMCLIKGDTGQACGKFHHKLLHSDSDPNISTHSIGDDGGSRGNRNVLLMVSEVCCGSKKVTVLWDSGANISLITRRAARKLNLRGKAIDLSITKVGNVTDNISTWEYVLPITDENGHVWSIPVYQIEEVTAELKEVDVCRIAKLFSSISENDIKRPHGKVDVLIGLDWCELMPEKIDEIGKLQLMRNPFGLSIRGTHPILTDNLGTCANELTAKLGDGNTVIGHVHVIHLKEMSNLMKDFMDNENWGIQYSLKCGNCKCGKCIKGTDDCTIKEEREMKMITEGLTLDEKAERWIVKYPWVRDAKDLPDNYSATAARLKSTESRLLRMGREYAEAYHNEIKGMLDRDAARLLTTEEIVNYNGLVHYMAHHEVLKPDS